MRPVSTQAFPMRAAPPREAATDVARVAWVDYAKGICIVLVVMMHSTLGVQEAAGATGFMDWVVAFARPFRMPDFFLISGLFIALVIDRDWRTYLDRKVVHFAYFYVLWLLIQGAFKWPSLAMAEGPLAVAEAFGLALIELGNGIYALQDGMSSLASLVPLGYAFGAGMVAAVNPCGILLLPSAVALYLARGGAAGLSSARRAVKALLVAAMATLGFVTIFAVVGLIIGAGGRALAGAFPLGGFLVGVVLLGLGGWLALTGPVTRVSGSVLPGSHSADFSTTTCSSSVHLARG